jgi:protoheme IX farnesyltransferase
LTLMPVVFGYFGAIYGAAALGLGAVFVWLSLRLWREAERRAALRTYLFSLGYLALLFCAMVLDARL